MFAIDNLDGVIANESVKESYLIGTTPVGTTLSDKAGNVASCSFSVRVDDVEPPTITCPKTAVFLVGDPDTTHARIGCEMTIQGKVSGNSTDRDGRCRVTVSPGRSRHIHVPWPYHSIALWRAYCAGSCYPRAL